MKILLADLMHTYSVRDTSLIVPLNIGYIKAYAVAEHGPLVDIRLFKHPEKLLTQLYNEQPEIVGLSNYGWNEQLNIKIGGKIRELYPDTLIVLGGPNIDIKPDLRLEFMKRHDYADMLIIDGGEEPFSGLITWKQENPGEFSKLPNNIVFRENNNIFSTDLLPTKKNI